MSNILPNLSMNNQENIYKNIKKCDNPKITEIRKESASLPAAHRVLSTRYRRLGWQSALASDRVRSLTVFAVNACFARRLVDSSTLVPTVNGKFRHTTAIFVHISAPVSVSTHHAVRRPVSFQRRRGVCAAILFSCSRYVCYFLNTSTSVFVYRTVHPFFLYTRPYYLPRIFFFACICIRSANRFYTVFTCACFRDCCFF